MDTVVLGNFFAAMLAILNPWGNVPVFLSETAGEPARVRRAMALLLSGVILGLLILFLFAGETILSFFGITIPAFRIAGGVILLLTGIQMCTGSEPAEAPTAPKPATVGETFDRAATRLNSILVPLAVPIFVGPGSISTVILFSQTAGDFTDRLLLAGILLVVTTITLLCLLTSEWVAAVLGRNGIRVVTRLLGLLLAAIAVQFMIDGVAQCTTGIIHPSATVAGRPAP